MTDNGKAIGGGALLKYIGFSLGAGSALVSIVMYVGGIQREVASDRATTTAQIANITQTTTLLREELHQSIATLKAERDELRRARDAQVEKVDNRVTTVETRLAEYAAQMSDVKAAVARIDARTESTLDLLRQDRNGGTHK